MVPARRKWQNSPHASRSAWVQTLKDLMRPAVPDLPAPLVCVEAETDRLSGSHDDGLSSSCSDSELSDPVPDDFMGVVDVPPFDGSSVACFMFGWEFSVAISSTTTHVPQPYTQPLVNSGFRR